MTCATYSRFKDFSFGRPCTGILYYNTVIGSTTEEGEILGAAAYMYKIVPTTAGATNTIIDTGTTSAVSPPSACDSTSMP